MLTSCPIYLFTSVPCTPSSIFASLDCNTQLAVVSWHQQGEQGVSYQANTTDSQGNFVSSCTSNSNNCMSVSMCVMCLLHLTVMMSV